MDRYFVYYHDGYYDNGDLGITSFEALEKALDFISERLKHASDPDLANDYILIHGQAIELEAVQFITKVRAKK